MPRRSRWIGALALACASTVRAEDVGVAGGVLVVRERARTAEVIYIATDPAVTKGPGEDADQIKVRFEMRVGHDGPAAAIVIPAGRTNGWRANRAQLAKHASAASSGRTGGARLVAIEPGGTLKLVAESRGDPLFGLPLAEVPDAPVFTAACVVNNPSQFCHCTEFPRCDRQKSPDGAGATLSCRGGLPDAACTASHARCLGSVDCALGDWNGDGMQLVACGGDSNTVEFDKPRWCHALGDLLEGVTVHPIAWAGTRASNDPGRNPRFPLGARVYLQSMFDKWPNKPDVIVLAWGTNDVPAHTPDEIVRAIDDLVAWMRSEGVVPLVATIPRRFDQRADFEATISAVNARLAERYGPCLVDFTTITPPGRAWYNDDRHLNAAAHLRRGIAAYEALRAAPRACGTETRPRDGRSAAR